MSMITDGTGNNYRAAVTSDKRLKVDALSETAYRNAVEQGNAFNINAYEKTLSATTGDQAVLYIKNNSADKDLELVNLFGSFWNFTAGTDGIFKVKVWQNVTGGTLISDASEIMIPNRSAGAIDSFSSDIVAYQATAGGKTFGTYPEVPNAFITQGNGRMFVSIDLLIPPQQTYGVTIDTDGGSADYYIGFAGYLGS